MIQSKKDGIFSKKLKRQLQNRSKYMQLGSRLYKEGLPAKMEGWVDMMCLLPQPKEGQRQI